MARWRQTIATGTQGFWIPEPEIKINLQSLISNLHFGCPAFTPPLAEMREAWQTIVAAADPFLDTLTAGKLLQERPVASGEFTVTAGSLMQRVIYHYWYHTGENMAIRQMLGHTDLPDFVGNIDEEAPYVPH